MKKWKFIVLAISVALVMTACGKDNANSDGTDTALIPAGAQSKALTVHLLNNNSDIIGTAELTENESGVLVKVNASDLSEGEHGIHFHEYAKCDGPDFVTAGDHFNPTAANHGEHAGDLANLVVGKDGTVKQELLAANLTLERGEANSLFKDGGTALVIHASADDGQTQPTGNAGDRIVCGIVKR